MLSQVFHWFYEAKRPSIVLPQNIYLQNPWMTSDNKHKLIDFLVHDILFYGYIAQLCFENEMEFLEQVTAFNIVYIFSSDNIPLK